MCVCAALLHVHQYLAKTVCVCVCTIHACVCEAVGEVQGCEGLSHCVGEKEKKRGRGALLHVGKKEEMKNGR